jgi:hypothetical protein
MSNASAAIDKRVLSAVENQDFIVSYWKGLRIGEQTFCEGSRLSGRWLMTQFGPTHGRRISSLIYTHSIYAIPAGTNGDCDSPVPEEAEFEEARARTFEWPAHHGQDPEDQDSEDQALGGGQAGAQPGGDQADEDQAQLGGPYDPSAGTIKEVMAYATRNPSESDDILAAETGPGGLNRQTLVKWLQG